MFTGIIEDLGKVEKLEREGDNLHITVSSRLTPLMVIDPFSIVTLFKSGL